jgi:hypothetical protein
MGGQLQGGAMGGQAQNAAQQGNLQNQYSDVYGQQIAMGQQMAPPPTFEENVPESELAYEGVLPRFPLYRQRTPHSVRFCQRCLML